MLRRYFTSYLAHRSKVRCILVVPRHLSEDYTIQEYISTTTDRFDSGWIELYALEPDADPLMESFLVRPKYADTKIAAVLYSGME